MILLAWQWWEIGFPRVADVLTAQALDGLPGGRERLATTLAAVQYLSYTKQRPRADALVRALLNRPEFDQDSSLWRLASALAGQRGELARSLTSLERALEIECRFPAGVMDLEAMRRGHARLLLGYQQMAHAHRAVGQEPPPDLLRKVLQTADRWRMLDEDPGEVCREAAFALSELGAHDLAWQYYSMTDFAEINNPQGWLATSRQLIQAGKGYLAESALALAQEMDPADARIVWERALNLQRLGEQHAARRLFKELADGRWGPDFKEIQEDARWELEHGGSEN